MYITQYGNLAELVEDIKKDCSGYETYSYKAKGSELNVEFFSGDNIVCKAVFVFEKNLIEGSYSIDDGVYDFFVKTDEQLHHLFARLG